MMGAFEICGSCRRHVKASEAACPFCGGTAPRRASGLPLGAMRLGRAALASVVSLVACSSTSGDVVDVGTADAADATTQKDSSVDDASDAVDGTDTLDVIAPDTTDTTDTADAHSPLDEVGPADANWTPDSGAKCPVTDYMHFVCGGQECFAYVPGPETEGYWQFWDRLDYSKHTLVTNLCLPCLTCDCLFMGTTCTPSPTGGVDRLYSHSCYGAPAARPHRASSAVETDRFPPTRAAELLAAFLRARHGECGGSTPHGGVSSV